MKLNAAQLSKVEEQLGVGAVPDTHPVTEDLKKAFGDHTFFLDAAGLNIVDPIASDEGTSGNVVKVASWTSEARTELRSHAPEVLPVTVEIEPDESAAPDEPDPAA